MRALIYNTTVSSMTSSWYREVLQRMPDNSRLLDIGVGTGEALMKNEDLLRQRNLFVQGIDIDKSYLQACQKNIEKRGLSDVISVRHQSVYDLENSHEYDGVYFSSSFMLLPDQDTALDRARDALKPSGTLFFTLTLFQKRSPFWEAVKPMLRWLTTIEFGKVTYEAEFLELLKRHEIEVVESSLLLDKDNRQMKLIATHPVSQS